MEDEIVHDELAANIAKARSRLVRPQPERASAGRALGAAALSAVSALTLAAAVILGPGVAAKDVAPPTLFGDK